MDNIFIKPRLIDGNPAIIPDPHAGTVLPPEGAFKPANAFWRRRLRDGDVIEAAPPSAAPVKSPAAAPAPAPSSAKKPVAAGAPDA